MESALKAVERGLSVRQAANRFGMPRATLHDRMKLTGDVSQSPAAPPKQGRYPVLPAEAEEDLAGRVLYLSDVFYGLDEQKIRSVAYEFAERNGLKHSFNTSSKMAGKDWLAGFLKRHPEISVRKAESVSVQRLEGQNKANVTRFFDNVQKAMAEHGPYPPHRVYNVDETGLSPVVENKRVLARGGTEEGRPSIIRRKG